MGAIPFAFDDGLSPQNERLPQSIFSVIVNSYTDIVELVGYEGVEARSPLALDNG